MTGVTSLEHRCLVTRMAELVYLGLHKLSIGDTEQFYQVHMRHGIRSSKT